MRALIEALSCIGAMIGLHVGVQFAVAREWWPAAACLLGAALVYIPYGKTVFGK